MRAGGGALDSLLAAEVRPGSPCACSSMDNDFVDVFPSAGGVGDSPVKTSAADEHLNPAGSSWSRPGLSLSIPADTGGREALVSPAVPGSRRASMHSMQKEGVLRGACAVSGAAVTRQDENAAAAAAATLEPPQPAAAAAAESPAPPRGLMPLTIEPGGDCVPTELEKKRAKLEKYRYECSEVGGCLRARGHRGTGFEKCVD